MQPTDLMLFNFIKSNSNINNKETLSLGMISLSVYFNYIKEKMKKKTIVLIECYYLSYLINKGVCSIAYCCGAE